MTGAEAKNALRSQEPVVLNDIEYACILEIKYTPYRGGIAVSAELKSKSGDSTAITDISFIRHTDENSRIPDVLRAPLPIDAITLSTYAGEFRIDIAMRDEKLIATEAGVGKLPEADSPYSEEDSVVDTWRHAINRVRDVAAAIIGDWYEARDLNRFTGVPIHPDTKK